MKYSEPMVIQGNDEITPRSDCNKNFNCNDKNAFSCFLFLFSCAGIFSCNAY